MNQRTIANISGYNGDELDPCPICGAEGDCTHADAEANDPSCCEALAQQVANLTTQIEALASAIAQGGATSTIVVRQVCLAGDGTPSLAYDVIPVGASSAEQITTIYRSYPAAEGPCVCAPT